MNGQAHSEVRTDVPRIRTPIRGSLWIAGAAGLLFLGVALAYAWLTVFSRPMTPDEGYLMITVQGFLEGASLYDSVFTQYGPFYYLYEWLVHAVVSVPLTHDATRMLTIVHWLATAVVLGYAAKAMISSRPEYSPAAPTQAGNSPSPPSEGGEGRGEEGRHVRESPLSPALSPLLRRGEREKTGLPEWAISWLAGVFVFVQVMVHLSAMAGEPGHPQELVALLLALGIFAVTRERGRIDRLALLATITAALFLTKINTGVFFGAALVLGMRCGAEDRLARGVWPWLLAGVCALLPFLLMWGHRGEAWCCNYSVLAASAIAASWLVAQRFAGGCAWERAKILRAGLFFLATCAAIVGVVLWTGTSLRGILDGLLLTPLKMPGVALLPLPLSDAVLFNAVVALAVAVVVRVKASSSHTRNAVTILKAIFGIAACFCLVGNAKPLLAFLLPWVWLVVAPTSSPRPFHEPELGSSRRKEAQTFPDEGDQSLLTSAATAVHGLDARPALDDPSHGAFPRVFLCLAAAWQGLQAYPIAGTQVMMATLLLVVAGGVCLVDALKAVAAQRQLREKFVTWGPRRLQFAGALAVIALLYVFANVWCKLPAVRLHYASLPALGLPGSRHVRFDQETTAMYRELARYLERECDTFVTYPGFNSLYFWTGKRPPTHLNSTGWGQLSHRQQERILGSLRQSQRPLLVVVAAQAESWKNGVPEPIRPLVRSVREDFREIQRISRFIVFAPRRAADTARKE